jgi:hypothetical protein
MPYVRGFRFPAPPATLGSSLPGLKGCAHFVSLPNLIAVDRLLYEAGAGYVMLFLSREVAEKISKLTRLQAYPERERVW